MDRRKNAINYNTQERLYDRDLAILKVYNEYTSKLTLLRSCRRKGFEKEVRPPGTVNECKLENNISRARAKIFEYAICNDWDWFATFTLDAQKYDRYNLEKFKSDISQFIRNFNSRKGTDIKYLLIPETHKDGAWHMHGFIMGLPEEFLRLFTLKEKLPKYIRDKLKKGLPVYDWISYRDKFGFIDLEPIQNQEACSKYVTKYISKTLAEDIKEVGAHLYYCSHGLRTAKEIKRGLLKCEFNSPDYENDYVKVKWFKHSNIEALCDMIN